MTVVVLSQDMEKEKENRLKAENLPKVDPLEPIQDMWGTGPKV